MHVARRMRRQPERLSRPDQLNVDVEVVSLLAVPDKGDLVAVGRKSRMRFQARKTGERDDVQNRKWRLLGVAKKHRPDCDSERQPQRRPDCKPTPMAQTSCPRLCWQRKPLI